MTIKRHEAMILSRRRRSDARQKFLPAIFLSPLVVAKFIFFAPNLLFLRILRQWRSVARTLHKYIISAHALISDFTDFNEYSFRANEYITD